MYILTLFLLLGFYGAVIAFGMKYMKRTRLWNIAFALSVFALYMTVVITVYKSVGFYDWNFQNTLPVANVSPFMFTLTPLALLFPKRIKEKLFLLISLLSVGMLLSAIFSCTYNAVIHYAFHLHFTCDYLAHVLLSLFGVYLVRSGQVRLTKKNAVISSSIIVGAAVLMLILNVVFDKAFFGLSLNGKHNIYNVVLTDSSYLSAALYFIGLCGVLLMGYCYSKWILKTSRKN